MRWLQPRHTLVSVAEALVEGLADRTVVFEPAVEEESKPEPSTQPVDLEQRRNSGARETHSPAQFSREVAASPKTWLYDLVTSEAARSYVLGDEAAELTLRGDVARSARESLVRCWILRADLRAAPSRRGRLAQLSSSLLEQIPTPSSDVRIVLPVLGNLTSMRVVLARVEHSLDMANAGIPWVASETIAQRPRRRLGMANLRAGESFTDLWAIVLDDAAYYWLSVPLGDVLPGFMDEQFLRRWQECVFCLAAGTPGYEACAGYFEQAWLRSGSAAGWMAPMPPDPLGSRFPKIHRVDDSKTH